MKTLLLNNSYEAISFLTLRRLIKLITKDRAEVMDCWDNEEIRWGSGSMKYPATIRMRYYVPSSRLHSRFNRKGVFKRDMYKCQYCGRKSSPARLTIDHVFPKSQGGQTTWKNCVSCCLSCNVEKEDRTPEEADMPLLHRPMTPIRPVVNEYILMRDKHNIWDSYFKHELEVLKR